MTQQSPESPRLIPREVLFGNPTHTSPQISSDGSRIAFLAPKDGVLNVWLRQVGSEEATAVTNDKDRGIRHYTWAHDNRHILYVQDKGGDENWRLYAVDLDSGETRDFTPFDNVQAQIIGRSKHVPSELLVGLNKDNPELHDVYRLHIPSGKLELEARNSGDISDWVTDAELRVRGANVARPDGGFDLLTREKDGEEWKTSVSWDPEDSFSSNPLAFTMDGSHLYLLDSRGAQTARLVKLNIANGETEVIAANEDYDTGSVVLHPDTMEVQAVSFVGARQEWKILDPDIEADFEAIRDLHEGDFFIVNRDHADRTWLLGYTVDNGPVPFFAYDRETRKGTFLFHHRPELEGYPLAPMEPVSFKSRDGFTVHGYLTVPLGAEKKNLPLILNVHGGPWVRDTWGFDPEVQWMANRGYACLQINYRGSTGYGKKFLNAGNREWGGKMHDDLVDAVRWAIKEGIADSRKICIYGGSYGGYAALVGAAFTPELFCCVVDIVGPSNLITFIRTIPPYWSTYRAAFFERVGNPETDRAFLESRSPLFRADKIRSPLLIAHGANDPRVKQAEAEQIVAALRNRGVDHEYLLFPDEGHGFAKPENRLRFYEAAEQFLAKHLGGRCESAGQTN